MHQGDQCRIDLTLRIGGLDVFDQLVDTAEGKALESETYASVVFERQNHVVWVESTVDVFGSDRLQVAQVVALKPELDPAVLDANAFLLPVVEEVGDAGENQHQVDELAEKQVERERYRAHERKEEQPPERHQEYGLPPER